MKKTTKFRESIERKEILVLPGIYSPWTARIMEAVGFEACYMSGGNTSRHIFGLPDSGIVTMTEVINNAANIANVTNIPVLCDADTAYGSAINTRRTVQSFIRAGIAAIHIEDQVSPKRCGFIAGKQLISLEEAVGKYRAAVDAKNEIDPDFVIVARCDARGALGGGFEEAIRRLKAYKEAGVDVLYLEAPQSVEEIKAARAALPGPLMCTCMAIEPALTIAQMEELGLCAGFFPSLAGMITNKAVWDYAVDFKNRGVEAENELKEAMKGHPLENAHEFSGFPEIRKWEEKYLPAEEVEAKYASTVGYQPSR